MAPISRRFCTLKLLIGGVIFLGVACEEDRRRKSSDDDDTGTGASTATGSGGGMTVAGGPEVTSLIASPATLTEGDSTTITATVVDDDGLEDIVGGVLMDSSGDVIIATFTQVSGGTFTASTSWWALHEIEPLSFAGETTRTVVARFTDSTEKVGQRSLALGLSCQDARVTQGSCGPCESCSDALDGAGSDPMCGWDANASACVTGSECERFAELRSCACESPGLCAGNCADFCDGVTPVSYECETCLSYQCGSQYLACG